MEELFQKIIQIIPDDKETRDVIVITDNLLKRIKNMNKIILERMRTKK